MQRNSQITDNSIRVLTLYQPWATFVINGLKKIETRPKPTSFRGTYLIHAAKKWTIAQERLCYDPFYRECLVSCGVILNDDSKFLKKQMNLGKALGTVSVSGCVQITFKILKDMKLTHQEYELGNFNITRWAWFLSNQKVLKNPFDYKGMQGYYVRFTGMESQLIFN